MGSGITYYVISPVRDEEAFVSETIRSMAAQTMLPQRWIVVDDASSDGTREILLDHASRIPWIEVVDGRQPGVRQPGGRVVQVFSQGYEMIKNRAFDFVVKLDCDITLGADYFERIFREFNRDSHLGIASGTYFERSETGHWVEVKNPDYHAAGASKVVRRNCFDQIGGFIQERGWDTVDEIRAWKKGWKTRHFRHIPFYHLKQEGAGIGQIRTGLMHGEIFYRTGGNLRFFLFKFLHRLVYGRPFCLNAFALAWGFLGAWFKRSQKLVDAEEQAFYRSLLNQRLRSSFSLRTSLPV